MTANEKRQAVVDKYRGILGRNLYSQPRRTYCFTKYANGKNYSDCSSSVALSYKAAGYPIRDKSGYACPNTVGMYSSPDLAQVDVTIQKGVIQDVEKLRVGDLLLFAGSDKGRASAGYVGHVEMVYRINGKTVTLCGHGSGTPRTTEMVAYCKSRYAQKTNTKLGHKGLIRVMRRIPDDGAGGGDAGGVARRRRAPLVGGELELPHVVPRTGHPRLGQTRHPPRGPGPGDAARGDRRAPEGERGVLHAARGRPRHAGDVPCAGEGRNGLGFLERRHGAGRG